MKKILILLLFIIAGVTANAETYYIDPTGVDDAGRNGLTTGTAWATLSYACTRATTAGDTIFVNAGTYNETAQSVLSVGVSIIGAGATSIITSANALDPIILMSSGSEGTDGNQSLSYFKIDGDLTIDEGIRILARKNVTIHHLDIIDCVTYGIYMNGRTAVSDIKATTLATGNSVYNCNITNCGYDYYNAGANAYWAVGCCLYIGSLKDILVYNNVFDNVTGGRYCYTIRGQHQTGTKIYNNNLLTDLRNETGRRGYSFSIEFWTGYGGVEVYNNTTSGALDFGGYGWDDSEGYGYAIKCYENTVALANQYPYNSGYNGEAGIVLESGSTGGAYFYRNYIANFSDGFSLSSTEESLVVGLTDVWVYYNIMTNIGFTDSGVGVGVGGYMDEDAGHPNKPYTNIYILNNVIHQSNKASGWGIVYETNLTNKIVWTNFVIRNNIIYNAYSPIMIVYQNIAGLHVDNNIFYEQTNPYPVRVTNGTITDFTENNNQASVNPLFVGGSPYSYKLQSTSPAINAGIDVGLSYDYDNKPIYLLPDIGAYEFGTFPASTGLGWKPKYYKENFRDTLNIHKGWKIKGEPVVTSARSLNRVEGVTSNIQEQLDALDIPVFQSSITIAGDTTVTAVVGKIVYQAADSSFYGCRSTIASKKWYKLNE